MIELVFKHFDDILILIVLSLYFGFFMPTWVALWVLFEKRNYHGFWSFVPLVNIFILMRIAHVKWFWIFVLVLPCLGYLILFWRVWRSIGLQIGYGKKLTFGLVLMPFFFIPFLVMRKRKVISIDTDLLTGS